VRPIAIVPRPGREPEAELDEALACLRAAGIYPGKAVSGTACALLWVEDERVSNSVDALRLAGLQATALTETDVPH
jgi:hypothetical protein